MIDAILKDFVDCFKASPADAQVDVARLWKLIQEVRVVEREACAVLVDDISAQLILSRNER